jgi:hypothetical protein
MKKTELKQLIKPLVKECIHEVLLEEGLLSNVVSEVAKGLQSNVVIETQTKQSPPQDFTQKNIEAKKKLTEHRKKMLDAIGTDAYNGVDLFEGTSPEGMSTPKPGAVDLGNAADAGVDISSIMGNASKIWQNMK